jgi:hypothetical protein
MSEKMKGKERKVEMQEKKGKERESCLFVTLENGMVGVGYVSVGLTTCGCTKS